MIITYDFKTKPGLFYEGVSHKYPTNEVYSARPQMVGR